MHTLHTRAASIYSSWAEEQRHLESGGQKIEADSRTLWAHCWCPLLQGKPGEGCKVGQVTLKPAEHQTLLLLSGIACLCCDARRQVRMQALTYLQRALLVHDLQKLDALEWESCFNKVGLLTCLRESPNHKAERVRHPKKLLPSPSIRRSLLFCAYPPGPSFPGTKLFN